MNEEFDVMHWLDYVVLVGYFVCMAAIGLWAMRRVKVQEDYFMGGRGFGKLLQTFAAFGIMEMTGEKNEILWCQLNPL